MQTSIFNTKFKSNKEYKCDIVDCLPKPLNDYIVIEPVPHNNIIASSIVTPDNMIMLPRFGRVLAIGPGKLSVIGLRLGCGVKVDDIVALRAHYVMTYGHLFVYNDKPIVIIPEQCVFAKLHMPFINDELERINAIR